MRTMSTDPYTLYARTNAGSLAVQIVLEEAGARYSVEWIARTEEALERYRRLNPAGKIPALRLPSGTVMSESAAILIYLAGAHPQAKLAPAPATGAYGTFLQWMVSLSANTYESALRYFYPERYCASGAAGAADVKAQALGDYTQHLETAGGQLRPYLLGEEYSAADAYLYMLLGWYPEDLEVLLKRVPALARHRQLLQARPAVQRAERDHAEPA